MELVDSSKSNRLETRIRLISKPPKERRTGIKPQIKLITTHKEEFNHQINSYPNQLQQTGKILYLNMVPLSNLEYMDV